MTEYKFSLKKNNSNVIFIDESKVSTTEFKKKFMNLLLRILESEEVILYLREIKLFLVDSHMEPSRALIWAEKGKIRPFYKIKRKGIELPLDLYSMYSSSHGTNELLKLLKKDMTHELIHYLHDSINTNITLIGKASEELVARYKKKYAQFNKYLGPVEVLQYLNAFVARAVIEGFAMLFERLKHEDLLFTKEKFEQTYSEAIQSAEILNKQFQSFKGVNLKNLKKLDEFINFKFFGVAESHFYTIGFHVVYSIIFLQKKELGTEIKQILKKFESHFGRLKPKKIVELYDSLMISKNFEPILTFRKSGGYINCREISNRWKEIFASKY